MFSSTSETKIEFMFQGTKVSLCEYKNKNINRPRLLKKKQHNNIQKKTRRFLLISTYYYDYFVATYQILFTSNLLICQNTTIGSFAEVTATLVNTVGQYL